MWWSTRPAAPVRGRGRPPRSLERIVSVALEIVDEVGTDAFSMRLLADRLGSGTATLYRHLAGKDELMVYVVDRILGEVHIETDAGAHATATWQDATARAASALYEVLKNHPNALPLLVSQVPVGPNALIHRERSVAVLLALGFRSISPRAPTPRLRTMSSDSPCSSTGAEPRDERTRPSCATSTAVSTPTPILPPSLPPTTSQACRSARSSGSACS